MPYITSQDGTRIAFDRVGQGPVLILVGGMFEQRALTTETAKLAALPLLAEHFTVVHYDRRGRGDSTDTLPYAVAREIEDIAALIDELGGAAYLFGISSGAALALLAARGLGHKVPKLALYEPPYNDDPTARQAWQQFRQGLTTTLAAGRYQDAVGLFMQLLGVPVDHLPTMHQYPDWPLWEAVAPTIAYDAAAVGEEAATPVAEAAHVTVPTLVMNGSESYPFMHLSALKLAHALPDGRHRTLQGQTHEVAPEVLAPRLIDFFTGETATALHEREVVSTRFLPASPAVLFSLLREPAHLSQWWGPAGFTNTFEEFDLRPGGMWRFVMHGPDGASYAMCKEFVEVEENARIALYHPQEGHRFWMTIDLAEQGAGTCLTWRMRFEAAAELTRIKPVLVTANEQNIDRLAAYLAQLPQ